MFIRAFKQARVRQVAAPLQPRTSSAPAAGHAAGRGACPCGGTCPRCAMAPSSGVQAGGHPGEVEADIVARAARTEGKVALHGAPGSAHIQRSATHAAVECPGRHTGLLSPADIVRHAEGEAIRLLFRAERWLDFELRSAMSTGAFGRAFNTIVREELGLTLADPTQHAMIGEQLEKLRHVRTMLQAGTIRYVCVGPMLDIIGSCEFNCTRFDAYSCPHSDIVALCPGFWNPATQRGLVLAHEAIHNFYDMPHVPDAPRLADTYCMDAFIARAAGLQPSHSCASRPA